MKWRLYLYNDQCGIRQRVVDDIADIEKGQRVVDQIGADEKGHQLGGVLY